MCLRACRQPGLTCRQAGLAHQSNAGCGLERPSACLDRHREFGSGIVDFAGQDDLQQPLDSAEMVDCVEIGLRQTVVVAVVGTPAQFGGHDAGVGPPATEQPPLLSDMARPQRMHCRKPPNHNWSR